MEIKFSYVVFDCGYTARTLAHWLNNKMAFKLEYEKNDLESGNIVRDTSKDMTIRRTEKDDDIPKDKLPKYFNVEYYNEPDYEDSKPDKPLFISDSVWGEGLYKRVGVDEKIIDRILSAVAENRGRSGSLTFATSGTIAFKCDNIPGALRIANNLKDLGFCNWCSQPIDNMEIILDIASGTKILIMDVDSESG